jgi:HAD superfamily hydrolase (TIGR01509 family)
MPLRGIIFDFDGVIANTEPLHLKAYQDVLVDTPFSLEKEAYYTRYLGYDDAGVFTALASDHGVALDRDQIQQLIDQKGSRFDALVRQEQVLFPGAANCIERLADVAPLGIASGAFHEEIEAILSRANLRRHFKAIVAADDVAESKPAPDSYLRAIELVGDQQDRSPTPVFVAIEDSGWGITAARAAGLVCVAVTHTYPAEELREAELIVADLTAIRADLLESLCVLPDESGRPVQQR